MPLDQNQYPHAMAEDADTGKPMQKVGSIIKSSESVVPVDIQSKLAQTVQTHNAVSVATGAWSNGAWIDCDGFDKLAITFKNDGATSSQLGVHWSNDGISQMGDETISASANQFQQTIFDIKARYARVNVKNADAASHTMSAWAYLKA